MRPDARILLLRLSALGDILFALPALQALRHQFPQARLEWLVEDRHAGLVEEHPGIDAVHQFPRSAWSRARGLGKLRAIGTMAEHLVCMRKLGPFDAILDLQGNLKSGVHLLFLRSERTLGFARGVSREGGHRFVRERVAVQPVDGADPRVHRVERDMALVRALGYEGPTPNAPTWELPRETVRQVAAGLAHPLSSPEGSAEGGPIVLLHTTTTRYGRDKAWPRSRWCELAQRLCAERGARVLLLWTRSDRTAVLSMAEELAGVATLAPPTPTLNHLASLLDQTDLLIGTDSGPLHLGAVRGNRVLGLYGPTDPAVYGPRGRQAQFLSALTDDRHPPKRDRSRPSPLMERIPVDAVLSRV